MRMFLVGLLMLAAVWDAFTTFYGTIQVLGSGGLQLMAAVLFSALIFAFLLNTRRIFRPTPRRARVLLIIPWFVSLCYDFYTSWVGNKELLLAGQAETGEIFILLGLTSLVVSSPMLLSIFLQQKTASEPESSPQKPNFSRG